MEHPAEPRRTRSRIGLTDTRVKGFKTTGKLYRVWDSHVPGFLLQVTPNGSKSFGVCFQRNNGQKYRATAKTDPLATELLTP